MTISNSINNGNVTGTDSTGGFVGRFISITDATISNCTNNGNITYSGNSQKGGGGGFVGHISSWKNTIIAISNCTNNGIVIGNGDCAGGLVGCIEPHLSFSLETINNANKGSVSVENGIACGIFCVNSEPNHHVSTRIMNTINKGNINATTYAYGLTNIANVIRNVVSMGEVAGLSGSYTFWNASNDAHLFFGLKHKCINCSDDATLFDNNTDTGFYSVVDSHEHVDDLLNDEAVNQHFGMVWSGELELVDKVNLTVVVSGLLDASFFTESGTPLIELGNLSDYFRHERFGIANKNE